MQLNSYQKTEIETADRGKLILMIYDHCLRWMKIAKEAIENKKIEERTKAIFKVQDGITELQCALDYERGGEIAKNLNRLYDFYGRHLSEANLKNSAQHIDEVYNMMNGLRQSWEDCFRKVRVNREADMNMRQKTYISMVG